MSVCSLADVPKTRISPLPRTTRPRPQKLPPIRIPPQVLTPQADGTKTFTTDTAVIDISHTQEGYIMAKYTGSNAKPKLQLTGTTRTLLHISTILNHYMLGFIIAFLVLLIICMILYHTDLGRVLFLGQKLAMTVASGRVANCLYLVLSSGLDSNIGLTLARELVNNPHMQALIDKCHENIRHRESFDKALLLSGIFSQMYASWIAIGSRTGEMESIVSQREINTDTASYLTALRAALRQINGIIYTSAAENMIAMDSSILQLYKDGRIDKHTAISEAVNPEIMSKRLNLL